MTTYLAGHEEADREGNGRGIMRQAFAVHRSHCQIYSRYRRFRLTTRFLLFFSFWRWSPIGGRVRRQTSKDDDGVEEVEEDKNDDTAQRARDSRTEKGKKNIELQVPKKNNYAYRQQERKQHLFAIRHISTSQGRRTNLASQGNNNTLFVLFFLLLSLYAIIGN